MSRFGIAMGMLAAALAGGTAHAQARVVDRVAAVVNDEMIPMSEVHRRAAPDIARLESEGRASTDNRHEALKRALDELIADRLLASEQKSANIEVTDQEIDLAMDDVRKQNHLDQAGFERALIGQGMSLSEYRDKLRRDLAAMKLLSTKVRSKVKVTDDDVRAEYNRRMKLDTQDVEVRARHIVVQVPANATPEQEKKARAKAEELAKRARSGEDFAELSRNFSDSPSKTDGGDVGFFKRGEMVPAFESAAFALKVGEVSEPVRSPFGWHVIKVEQRRAAEPPPFDKVKDDLREKITREQMQKQTESYIAELRKQATVEVRAQELR